MVPGTECLKLHILTMDAFNSIIQCGNPTNVTPTMAVPSAVTDAPTMVTNVPPMAPIKCPNGDALYARFGDTIGFVVTCVLKTKLNSAIIGLVLCSMMK